VRGKAQRVLLLGSVVGIVGLAFTAAVASAAAYDTYVACGTTASAPPSHQCDVGEPIGAFFRSNAEDVIYGVCVKFSSGGDFCADEQVGEAGALYVNRITAPPGRLTVTWTVAGQVVGSWGARVIRPSAGPAAPRLVRRTCGLLPGEGAFSYVKTVGIRCRAAKRIAHGARRRFCARHHGCRVPQPPPIGFRYRGKVVHRGWTCRVSEGWEFLLVRCRKGDMRIHQEAAA
jgi:hypothetical protein